MHRQSIGRMESGEPQQLQTLCGCWNPVSFDTVYMSIESPPLAKLKFCC